MQVIHELGIEPDFCAEFPPITVRCLPGHTVMHGCYHEEGFGCPFCGHRQVVEIEG